MLEKIYETDTAIYTIIAICGISFILKLVMLRHYNYLIKEASEPGNVKKGFVKSVLDKFAGEYEQSYRVNNVSIFVDKYMYDITMMGVKYSVWETLGILSVILCLTIGSLGAIGAYYYGDGEVALIRYIMCGLVSSGILVITDVFVDIQRKKEQFHTNMCNYLDNYLRPRLEQGVQVYSIPDSSETIERLDEGMLALLESLDEGPGDNILSDAACMDDNIIDDIITEYLT